MLDKYPKFERGQIDEFYNRLPKTEQEVFEEYLTYRVGRSKRGLTSKDSIKDIRRYMLHLRFILQKKFDEMDLKNLRKLLEIINTSYLSDHSKNDLKIDLKRFIKWHFQDYSKRFAELEDIRLTSNPQNNRRIEDKDILKKADIERIMQHETKMFWKAFFITQYEGGFRTKENRLLKWDDIKFNVDGDISEITIFATKTNKERTIYVKEATFYLKKLKEEQENLEKKGKYVFHSKKDFNKPIDKGSVSIWARGLAKRSGKYFWSYLLRHSRGTELYTLADENKIAENTASKFMGHNKSMKDVYLHSDKEKVKKMLKDQVYKLEELPPKAKREFEEKLEELNKKQETLQAELQKRKQLDPFLDELFSSPQIQKMLKEKKKVGVLGK